MNLYLDDNYDYSNGTFTGMSDKTKSQFMKDLQTFYTAFTENNVMPSEITKFSDIKLRDYRSKSGCQGSTPILKSKLTLNKKDKLFVQYAENIKQMIQSAADNQYKLLDVINELFTYVIDPYSGKKVIRINPKLTDQTLQNSVVKTRRLIVNLYVKCETDYVNGMKIYEAIVESKILDTTQKLRDRLGFKQFVLKVNSDTFIYTYTPNLISLDESGRLFTLTLLNKKFIFDILEVDNVKDYIDVYLFGIKQPQDKYGVESNGNNIIVTFTSDVTRLPNEVNTTDFEIKGKIAEIL
jgi:hypothetical protein